jgi:hypothetical protein
VHRTTVPRPAPPEEERRRKKPPPLPRPLVTNPRAPASAQLPSRPRPKRRAPRRFRALNAQGARFMGGRARSFLRWLRHRSRRVASSSLPLTTDDTTTSSVGPHARWLPHQGRGEEVDEQEEEELAGGPEPLSEGYIVVALQASTRPCAPSCHAWIQARRCVLFFPFRLCSSAVMSGSMCGRCTPMPLDAKRNSWSPGQEPTEFHCVVLFLLSCRVLVLILPLGRLQILRYYLAPSERSCAPINNLRLLWSQRNSIAWSCFCFLVGFLF